MFSGEDLMQEKRKKLQEEQARSTFAIIIAHFIPCDIATV